MITIFERMKLRDHFEEGAKLADTVLRDDAFLAAMERGAKLLVDALGSGHKICPAATAVPCAMPCTSPKS